MERGDNSINIGVPTTTNMNSSSSATLGLDMHLNSAPHLSFHQGPAGPIRHHHSSSPFSPYPSIPRSRQPTTMDSDETDVISRRPLSASQLQNQQNQQAANCPWARMKWTEGMVRLLIAEVYRVGDDGGGGGTDGADHHAGPSTKGANRTSGAAKGKWKSVSKAMIDKGFYVSPQQCEDKFNDLNKRYKRVIDLLGKGTACRVVENPTLLDSMDNLTPKAKEEARKLLNSKHLFFPEMCAYHNAGTVSSVHPSSSQMNNLPLDQQQCMHHQAGTAETMVHPHPSVTPAFPHSDEEEDQDNSSENESNESSDKEEEYDTDYYEAGDQAGRSKKQRLAKHHSTNSPPLSLSLSSTSGGGTAVQQLKNEMMGMISTGGDGVKQWMKIRSTELEEQRVSYQLRAYQLERQRFKWLRYSTNKEREMERKRLQNDRLRLENERMLLLLRQKEMELCGNGNESYTGTSAGTGTEQIQFQQQQAYMHK
ncbi:hypothetical protein LUZ60_003785 [Juncus effusus]|nr:hypothetical protein LUZ60_003785 [Juncus effusus]